MNQDLTTSAAGERLIKAFETCMRRQGKLFTTYYCPAGVLTIGYGHTNANGRKIRDGDVWTQGECDAALRQDLAVAARAVRRRVRVALTQEQFDALVSFTFNLGEGALARSTLLREINARDFDDADGEFAKWDHADGKVLNGLVRRRKAEADLFRTGNHEMVHAEYKATPEYNEPCPQRADIPPGTPKPMKESKIGNSQILIGAAGAAEAGNKIKDALDQANSIKQSAKDLGAFDTLVHLATMPTFWLAVAIVIAAGAAWYWRREHAQAGV